MRPAPAKHSEHSPPRIDSIKSRYFIFYTKPAGVTGTNGPMFKYFIRSSVQAETRQVGFEKCVSVVKILPGRIFS